MASWLSNMMSEGGASGNTETGPYAAGQAVEYYSGTLQNWMPAKILQFNSYSNTYNLDCKPEVPLNRIRPLSDGSNVVGGGGGNSPASRVTVSSTSGVTPAGGTATESVNYSVGMQVEYYSATAQSWIPAKIQYVNADGTYNLDCKPLVAKDRIRPMVIGGGGAPVGQQSQQLPGSSASSLVSPAGNPSSSSSGAPQPQPVSQLPDPNSGLFGGTSQTGASSPGTGSGGGKYAPNQQVEYLSGTLNQWISARILSVNNDGTYNLDCKPLVAAERIRPSGSGTALDGANKPRTLDDVRLEEGGTAEPRTSQSSKSRAMPATMAVIPEIESFTDHPMKSATTIKSLDGPIQLIRLVKSGAGGNEVKFELCKEAVEILRGMGAVKLSVVTVAGAFRTGKSYLLNLLLDRVQQGLPGFQVGVGQGTYTKGIWMFALKPTVSDDNHCYLYLDCEGFSEKSNSADSTNAMEAKLLALSILISSLFVLNVKGPLEEDQFNSTIGSKVTELKNLIEGLDSNIGGSVMLNKPSLLFLLRDYGLANNTSSDEYLEKFLSNVPEYPFEPQKQQLAKDTRIQFHQYFPDRRCRSLVQPVNDDGSLARLPAANFADLRPDFQQSLRKLQDEIYRISSALGPKRVGKDMAYLTARAFPSFLAHLCDTLNTNQKLELCNSWDRVAESSCCNSVENLTTEYREAIDLLRTKFPLADANLQADLKALKQHMRERFKDEALGDEAMRLQYWNELKDGIVLDNKKLWDDNNRAAENKLLRLLQMNEGSAKFPTEVIKEIETQLKENAIPVKCCHAVAGMLLKAYLQVLDSSKLHEQRIKENEEEKEQLRTSISTTGEEKKRLEDKVTELSTDLEQLKKTYSEEVATTKQLRETLENMASSGTDKEKELAHALQDADLKYQKHLAEENSHINSERKKREEERERFDMERTNWQREKEDHREALKREHESAMNAWEQVKSMNTKLDAMSAEMAKGRKGAPCQCAIM
ncbi:unnamed protein product [Amoebophrya sp. A120]|nr:unnamed protein product [Amoebophrya sp. A120]|eukprot:GSA120T00004580001.1